jgi:hypothetical protein
LETCMRELARDIFATASESHPDLLIGNQVLVLLEIQSLKAKKNKHLRSTLPATGFHWWSV